MGDLLNFSVVVKEVLGETRHGSIEIGLLGALITNNLLNYWISS